MRVLETSPPPESSPPSLRVLVFSHSCVIAVNQQVYVDLAALTGVEVALVLPNRWKSEYDGSEITPTYLPEVTFPVYALPVGRPGSVAMHYYKRLPNAELQAWKPDVILASQEPYSVSGWQALRLARRLGVPFIFQTNQNIVKSYPPPFSWFETQCLRHAAVALAYSEEARQVMTKKGRTGPSDVLPYATDVRLFQPRGASLEIAARVAALRAKMGLGVDDFVIGYVGRLVPEKGLETLIEAVALLPEALRQRVRVLFVGSGSAEAALRMEAETRGIGEKVVFAGAVAHAEVPTYMAALDVFALPSRTTPSWKEQFGRVIIEALACGVPVVGSDSGQIPHLVRETGGGVVFPEGDAAALAAALASLINDARKRVSLAECGSISVKNKFTCPAVARSLWNLFRSLQNPSPR